MAIYHYGLTATLPKTEFQKRERFLEQLIAKLEKRLANAPEGSLVVSKTAKGTYARYLVMHNDSGRIYLNKSHHKTIARLAQKEYDRKALFIAKKELSALRNVIAYCDIDKVEDAFLQCHEGKRDFIAPAVESDASYRARWLSQNYVQKQKSEGTRLYPTEKGDLVQSKSEGMQANYLFHHDYAYLYEKRITLNDHGRTVYRYPDFTILDPVTRTEVIFEHFGMVDDAEYYQNSFIDKLRLYLENGYVIGETFLFTFETHDRPFTMDQFERVLEARFGKKE